VISTIRSPDEKYQYELRYQWADGPVCGWILLNPSRPKGRHAQQLGSTGQRCANYARAWGYSGIVIRNRFAYRATDPGDLLRVDDPYGPENMIHLAAARDDPITVAAWGASMVVETAPPLPEFPLMCLGVNDNGSPRHVLNAPATVELRPWKP
jgi:hypothetical protein